MKYTIHQVLSIFAFYSGESEFDSCPANRIASCGYFLVIISKLPLQNELMKGAERAFS